MNSPVEALFVGRVAALPDGRPSAIVKQRASGAVALGREGLHGDEHADVRVHGGPDKALHHYPAQHYAALAAAFPQHAGVLAPGALGENLSLVGWDEDNVCVGDVFALGACRVQVSQPRRPCWKIDARLGSEGVGAHLAGRGMAGWYYRVLEGGMIAAGDRCALLDRSAAAVTLRRLWQAEQAHRPALDELALLAQARGLAAGWAARLRQRLDWLRHHGTR